MSDNMFKFIMTLVPVFGAIITYFVIPYIKSKVSQTQMEEIIKWVTKAVEAAEVLFDVPKSGEEKREYVIKFIDKMFNSKKEVITEEQIRIVELCELCITIKGDTTLLKPSPCFCEFRIESLPEHFFGACCGSNFLETETPIKYDRGCSIGSNCTVMG